MMRKFLDKVTDPKIWNKANEMLKNGFSYNAELVDIYGEDYYRIEASFQERRESVYACLVINYNQVFRFTCQCDTHYYRNHYCEHFMCLVMAADEYCKKNPISRTNKKLSHLMKKYVPTVNDQKITNRVIHLVPNLSFDEKGISVTYKIGENKFYIIKNLSEFVHRMKNHDNFSYGKNFAFEHDESKFDEISLKNYEMIKSFVDITESFVNEHDLRYYNYANMDVKKTMSLKGKMIDDFFSLNYGRDVGMKLSKDFDPKLIQIQQNDGIFEIKVPDYYLIKGDQYSYIYNDDTLYQVDSQYNDLEEIINTFHQENGSMVVDENDMKELCSSLLPVLSDKFEVATNFDITPYEPLKAEFKFILDSVDNDVTLEYALKYGDKDYRINVYEDGEIRNLSLETRVDEFIHHYFVSEDQLTFHIKNDDALFELISYGIDELNNYGEVYATNKFKKLQLFKTPNINIGVSLESDLLNFKVDIEGVDLDEINAILNSYKLKKKYHRLTSGQFLMIDESKFEAIEEIAGKSKKDLKALAEGNLSIPMYRSLYLDKLLEESDGIEYDANSAFKKLIKDFDHIKNQKVEVPANLQGELREYQKEGYEWLLKLHQYHFGGILADDMGLGKTLQVITLLLKLQKELDAPSLIVCPASLVYNWESEIKRFAPDLSTILMVGGQKERVNKLDIIDQYDVVITSYDLLKRDITYYENKKFSIEVIDEAQFIKNANTLQSKAVKGIKASTKFALSGTPIENKLSELWSIFDYLMPGFLYNYNQFRNEFENPVVKNNDEMAMARLQKMIGPFILRRNKKDVLKDLPDKIDKLMYAKMDKKQEDLYTTYAKRIKLSLAGQTDQAFKENKIMVLQELTRLRQLCCDPNLFLEDYHGESCKLQQCLDLIETGIESNHKILLFSQFKSMLDIIGHELTDKGIQYYMIAGETSKEKRIEYVNRFNHDQVPVFLISLKAGGTGLNLTAADIVIHYDPWWNEAAMNQATDRAHRIGQKNVVTVYKMIVKDTIEEQIVKLQESKAELANSILEGSSTSLSSLSRDDLLAILK